MCTIRRRAWPWFALAALLLLVGTVIVHGSARSVVQSVAVFLFVAACIRALGLLVRDNPVGAEMVTRRSIEAGVAGWMAQDSADRRARRRAGKRPAPGSETDP